MDTMRDVLPDDQVDYMGGCPTCHGTDGCFNAGKAHWYVCHEHRVRWCVGTNLFSGWREQTEDEQRHLYEVDPGWGSYEEVEPYNAPHFADPTWSATTEGNSEVPRF